MALNLWLIGIMAIGIAGLLAIAAKEKSHHNSGASRGREASPTEASRDERLRHVA